jgi:rare lipoprotein A
MGRETCSSGIERVGVLALAAVVLAACTVAPKNSNYSMRVVEEGEPVPKGGGDYKVGQPYLANGRAFYPSEDPHYRAEGIASWYGADFHGRLTANGEVYDMNGISAAHPTVPLPSYLRVTNLANGRSLIVRVNDRGPYAKNRIVDLSIGAAKALDFHGNGLARVRVEYVGRAPLEGSDDQMLLATLRHGVPAPAPSVVRIASAKPIPLQLQEGGRAAARTIAAARPLSLSAEPTRLSGSDGASADRRTRSAARLPVAAPTAGAAPGTALGLVNGHGLY